MGLRDLLSIDDLLRPALLITWAVPAARLQPRLPAPLALDTVPGPDGTPQALLSVAVVLNVDVHLHLLPGLRTTAAQANFRTYVRPLGADAPPGVYFFGHYISTRLTWLPPWLLSPNAFYAPARLAGRVPAAAAPSAGWHVSAALRGPLGPLRFVAAGPCAPPRDALFWPDAAAGHHFLTQRLRGYFADRWGGLAYIPVAHAEMTPWGGHLTAVTCAPWARWGLLTPAEIARPLSVLVQPAIPFRAYPPARLPVTAV